MKKRVFSIVAILLVLLTAMGCAPSAASQLETCQKVVAAFQQASSEGKVEVDYLGDQSTKLTVDSYVYQDITLTKISGSSPNFVFEFKMDGEVHKLEQKLDGFILDGKEVK